MPGLRQHAVTVYLVSFFLTNVGVGGFTLVTGLALYRQTGNASAFGYLVAIEYGLGFVGQTVGGSVLDRRPVLGVALTSNTLRTVMVLLGGALLWSGCGQLALIIAFLVSAFIRPVYRSASFVLARLVSPVASRARVNALRFALLQAAQLCGMGVVAGLYAVLPVGCVVCVVGVLFLVGTATLTLLRATVHGATADAGTVSEDRVSLAENWRQLGHVLGGNPGLRMHLILGALPAVITSLATVLVAPVNAAFGGRSIGVAVLDGSASVGALLAVLLVRRIGGQRSVLVGVSCAIAVGSLLLLAAAPSLAVAGLAFFLLGIAAALGATSLDTLLQSRASAAILGRLAITQECAISLTAIALIPLSGPLIEGLGVHGTALLYGSVTACYLLVFVLATAALRGRLFTAPADVPTTSASAA